MAKITRVQLLEKQSRLGQRKREQRNRETNKDFVISENEPNFAEVFQEAMYKFQNRPVKGYFMADTMSAKYWQEREENKLRRY
jgi:hypothetical protein